MKKAKTLKAFTLISLTILLSGCNAKSNTSTQTNLLNNALTHEAEISSDGIPPATPPPTPTPSTPPPAPKPTPTPPAATPKTVAVTITGGNYYFKPAVISAKKGDTVKIVFKNEGGLHDLVIDDFKVATPRITNGKSSTVQFVATKTGTFEYYCSVGSHRQMGMKGTLIIN